MIHTYRKVSFFLLVLVAAATCSIGVAQERTSGDSQLLQGTWLADLEPGLKARLDLNGKDLLYVHLQGQRETVVWKGYFSVDEKPQPKQMDWTPLTPGRVPPSLGIYRLDGDLLLVVSSKGTRPAAFYSGGGSYRPKTVIFRRVKSQDEPPTVQPNQ